VNVTVSPAVFIPLVGGVVPSSARGPSYSYNAIKPDIAAPGASVSAVVGTGDGQEGFGGTSGATPMVAGSAALLIQAYPDRGPAEIKALLMNTAEINIQTDPALGPGVPAPITRIGGGEVRVDRALKSKTAAWDADALSGSLSFGYHAVSGHSVFTRRVTVRNYSNHQRTFTVAPQFRYADDAASKAVTVQAPSHIFVPANSSASFNVCLSVNASQLPIWNLNGGDLGGEGDLLQGLEFDGYLNVSDGADKVHLAWQILPHRAAEVQPIKTTVAVNRGSSGTVLLSNRGGAVDGRVEVFSLTGTSPRIRRNLLPGPGDNFAIIDLKSVGTRLVDIGGGESGIQFAINTYGERAHPNYPAELDVLIDANRDGTPDFDVFNSELGPLGSSGQNVVNVLDLNTGDLNAYFFTDADLNSADAILTAPLSAVGLTPDTRFDFSIFAFDNYFTGNVTDSIEGMTYTPQQPRFIAFGVPDSGVPAGGASLLNIVAVPGGETASPSQLGLLLLYRDGKPGREADAIRVGRHP